MPNGVWHLAKRLDAALTARPLTAVRVTILFLDFRVVSVSNFPMSLSESVIYCG